MSRLEDLEVYCVQYIDNETGEIFQLTHKINFTEVDVEEVMCVFTSDEIETTDELIKLGMMIKEQDDEQTEPVDFLETETDVYEFGQTVSNEDWGRGVGTSRVKKIDTKEEG